MTMFRCSIQSIILPAFRRVRKIAKSDYELRRVCPSARMEQLGCHWTDYYESLYLNIFRKLPRKFTFD